VPRCDDSSFLSGSPPFIPMVQATDLRKGHDGPHLRRLNRSWLRRVLSQRKMRSRLMVQVDNLIPIVLNRESFSIRGIRGVDVLSGFTERF
jgi:hypothetical protein